MAADALQDALASLDALAGSWCGAADALLGWKITLTTTTAADAIRDCANSLRVELAAIRAAHNLPASAASSAAPPADAPPCSAGLTAGASPDAPAISRGADRAVDFTPGEALT